MNSGGGAKGTFPLTVPNPHAFADAGFRHVGTDFIDHAGAIAMRDDPRKRYFSRGTQSRFDVRWVHPGGRELDADFARSGVRRFDFANL
jgi:hypothetical protein